VCRVWQAERPRPATLAALVLQRTGTTASGGGGGGDASGPAAVSELVSALRGLAAGRTPLVGASRLLVRTKDVHLHAEAVLGCLEHPHWRVRHAALLTVRVWGLASLGELQPGAGAAASSSRPSAALVPRSAAAAAAAAASSHEGSAGVAALAGAARAAHGALGWRGRSRGRAQRLSRRRGAEMRRRAAAEAEAEAGRAAVAPNAGNLREVVVVCPEDRGAGDALAVVLADGAEFDTVVPAGVYGGMEFCIDVPTPSLAGVVAAQRLGRAFGGRGSRPQRARLRAFCALWQREGAHHPADSQSRQPVLRRRAEIAQRLRADRELEALLLEHGGRSGRGGLKALLDRVERPIAMGEPTFTLAQFLSELDPEYSAQKARMLGEAVRDLEKEAERQQSAVSLDWSAMLRAEDAELVARRAARRAQHSRAARLVACLADAHPAVRAAAAAVLARLGIAQGRWAGVSTFSVAVLTGICLYAACSCHEITEWKRPGQLRRGCARAVRRARVLRQPHSHDRRAGAPHAARRAAAAAASMVCRRQPGAAHGEHHQHGSAQPTHPGAAAAPDDDSGSAARLDAVHGRGAGEGALPVRHGRSWCRCGAAAARWLCEPAAAHRRRARGHSHEPDHEQQSGGGYGGRV
jgi:hypothetical protein